MSRRDAAERALSAVLSIATVVGVGVLLERRINDPTPRSSGTRIEQIGNWELVSKGSVATVTENKSAVDVVTFTDFECPMCKVADSVITALIEHRGLTVNRRIVSFPLPGHRSAMGAALAFECSSSQGRGSQMYKSLYESTHLFGSAPWQQLARAANVLDSAKFAQCMGLESSKERILAGLALGKRLKISGTPAFVINGTLYDAAPLDVVEKALVNAVGGSHTSMF